MKNLIDIVAVELKSWPRMAEGGTYLCQDSDNGLIEDTGTVDIMMLSERARDADTARIFKADWQAAVEALKAEQAAELKWPEGAEFVGTTEEGSPKVFYRNVDGDYEYRYEHEVYWSKSKGAPVHTPLIPRPTERAVEWDGDGEPPVGTECEWHPNVHGWVKVKILGRDGADTWYRAAGEEHSQTCRNMAFFRPIRTQEQIERDAFLEEILKKISDKYGVEVAYKCKSVILNNDKASGIKNEHA